jgi:excisionase family DNA binding protein
LLLKINEIIKRIPVHRNTILNWINNGEIKATKIGRQYFIDEDELNKKIGDNGNATTT